jgi:hypothetical protein
MRLLRGWRLKVPGFPLWVGPGTLQSNRCASAVLAHDFSAK